MNDLCGHVISAHTSFVLLKPFLLAYLEIREVFWVFEKFEVVGLVVRAYGR